MLFKSMMALALGLLCGGSSLFAMGGRDSVAVRVEEGEQFRPVQLALPASLVAAGTLGLAVPQLKAANRDVRDALGRWRDGRYFRADDYLQYLPVVSHLGLSLLGAKAKHGYVERICVIATSYAAMGIMVNGLKYTVRERRPDGSTRNSFPSGHTATAFMGAELVRMEYKDDSPLYGIGAYTVACGVAFLRLYNERHWCNDVLAGAGIGILSARIGYWLLPLERKWFRLDRIRKGSRIAVFPYYDAVSGGGGGMLAFRF